MITGDSSSAYVLGRVIKGDVKLHSDFEYRVYRCRYTVTDTVYELEDAGLAKLFPGGAVKPTPAGKVRHAEWSAARRKTPQPAEVVFQPAAAPAAEGVAA